MTVSCANDPCSASIPLSLLNDDEGTLLSIEDVLEPVADEWRIVYCDPDSAQKVTDEPIAWATALFEPTDFLEIRCIPPKAVTAQQSPRKSLGGRTCMAHGFRPWTMAHLIDSTVGDLATFNDPAGVITYWGRWDRKQKRFQDVIEVPGIRLNIYCSANPRLPGGGSKADVTLARSLFVDIEHIPVADALARVEQLRLPPPTVIVNSGHGIHLYWRLIEPIYDLDRWTSIQKRLIAAFNSDPSIHDPARMMRLPGFTNVNGDPKPCTLVETEPHRRYDLDDLLRVLPELSQKALPVKEQAGASTEKYVNGFDHQKDDSRPRPDDLLDRMVAYQATVPPASEAEHNRNSSVFRLAAALTEYFDPNLDQLSEVVSQYNARFDEPLDDDELQDVTCNGFDHVHNKGIPRGTQLEAALFVETFVKLADQPLTLEQCRHQMAQARRESLKHPDSINFDGAVTGAGKSTADISILKNVTSSVTFVPTHDACSELVQRLQENNFTAAAYPALNETTCQRFGTDKEPGEARIAQRSGLDVGESLCPGCPFFDGCPYQERRDAARNATHSVATQARASHSDFAPADDKAIVFIHEDFRKLLRPTIKVTANPLGSSANAPCLYDLRDVVEIARTARDISRQMDDQQKTAFFITLLKATKRLIGFLSDDILLNAVQQASANGQLNVTSRVQSLPLCPKLSRPHRTDSILYRAMRQTFRYANGEALRLAVAYACGELDNLCLVIDDTFSKTGAKGTRKFHKSLIGVRRVDPPRNKVVWFEDATGDPALLEKLVGRAVCDRTPIGRISYSVPPIQYGADVTMQTSGNVVRGLVRGLLIQHKQAKKLGIITHSNHLPDVRKLQKTWADRLHMLDYFHSGSDRASNRWLSCDLIIILGTPRVPPSAVREGLIQIGQIAEAGQDGQWTMRLWEGHSTDDQIIQVVSRGYKHPAWAYMHKLLVRDALIQAIGRGRGVMESGVPVVVVSNEPLGIPLAASGLTPLHDPEAETYQAIQQLTAFSPTYNNVGENAVSTPQIVEVTGYQVRQTQKHCLKLITLGLLARKGARGGWMVANNDVCQS